MSPLDDEPTSPAAATTEQGSKPEGEEAVLWAMVLASWNEEAAHRAYLDRFRDLEGLAEAGRRYRDVLDRNPTDQMARHFRDEILKRATVQGLALLPRSAPLRPAPGWLKKALIVLFSLVTLGAAYQLLSLLLSRHRLGVSP